jgi:glycogen debranching enzyme
VVLTIANRSLEHVSLHHLPFVWYYGDFASPLAFVIALAHHFAWSGDRGFLQRHWDTARCILDWGRERGDHDGDGLSRVSDEVA